MIYVSFAHRGKRHVLSYAQDRITIGAAAACDVMLLADEIPNVQPFHLEVRVEDGVLVVHDLRGILPSHVMETDDSIRFGDVELKLAFDPLEPERVTDDVERRLLAQIRTHGGDVELRRVYADWLEQHGERRRGEFLRLQLVTTGAVEATASEVARATDRLRALATDVGPGWRACVASSVIVNCPSGRVELEVVCPQRWDQLTPTDHPGVRSCEACKSSVTYCTTAEQALEIANEGGCITLDARVAGMAAQHRSMVTGRPAPQPVRYGTLRRA